MKKILITPKSFRDAGEIPYRILKEHGLEITENNTGKTLDEEQMAELCADVEGLLVGIDPVSRRVIENAPRLKAISKYGAGLDNIDLEAAKDFGIEVRRAAGTNAVSVAELSIGLMFALARNIVPLSLNTRKGGWNRTRGVEITGKTLGIIGLGNIGREVARMAHGLGMDILGYDPFVDTGTDFIRDYDITVTSLEDVFRGSDFVTLHLPLTGDTKYMVGHDAFALMRPSACLINTARGELVDENAMYEALCSGTIAGAASDVFSSEPPGDSPLMKLDNFILTPHIGAYTVEANRKMAEVSALNLVQMLGKGGE